jgi:hypothetical protein
MMVFVKQVQTVLCIGSYRVLMTQQQNGGNVKVLTRNREVKAQ